MADIPLIDLTGNDSDDMVETPIVYSDTDSILEIDNDPLYGNWTPAMQQSVVGQVEQSDMHAASLNHMALYVASHNIRVGKLIEETQHEVLRKLPKSSVLSNLTKGQIRKLLFAFVAFVQDKIDKLKLIVAAFSDYDQVTGGRIFHVQRLIVQLRSVKSNVRDFVLAQLGKKVTSAELRKVGPNPKYWKNQQLVASLQAHLDMERRKLKRIINNYAAVVRAPPVIPPPPQSAAGSSPYGIQM